MYNNNVDAVVFLEFIYFTKTIFLYLLRRRYSKLYYRLKLKREENYLKIIKKIASTVSVAIICIAMSATSAYAATLTQDNLEVNLSTDKNSYLERL